MLLALAVQAAIHVVPPVPETHVHPAPSSGLKVCPVEGVIPPELAGWRAMVPASAARNPVAIPVGTGVRAKLLPGGDVVYPVAPAKKGAPGTSGGVFVFEVARAGRYRVALGAGAWIDVVQGSTVLQSKAHGHGPQCSPVRKMVDFDLAAGRHLLELSGAPSGTLALMVAKLG
jgi:hypothetical protein